MAHNALQTKWKRGEEPWRKLRVPVNEEQVLNPEDVQRVKSCQEEYYKRFRLVRALAVSRPNQVTSRVPSCTQGFEILASVWS